MTAVAAPLILSTVYESGGVRRWSSHERPLSHLSVQAMVVTLRCTAVP